MSRVRGFIKVVPTIAYAAAGIYQSESWHVVYFPLTGKTFVESFAAFGLRSIA